MRYYIKLRHYGAYIKVGDGGEWMYLPSREKAIKRMIRINGAKYWYSNKEEICYMFEK